LKPQTRTFRVELEKLDILGSSAAAEKNFFALGVMAVL
jgi:hypothetical protein